LAQLSCAERALAADFSVIAMMAKQWMATASSHRESVGRKEIEEVA
jgi:hypothetical protein